MKIVGETEQEYPEIKRFARPGDTLSDRMTSHLSQDVA